MTMKAKTLLLAVLASLLILSTAPSYSQNVEITGNVGYQVNGGADLQTSIFHRIEVGNSFNYGLTVGYLLGEHYGLEFQWNRTNPSTYAEPIGGGPSPKIFTMSQNQYLGNFLIHFTPKDATLRPFFMVGMGASSLSPERRGIDGSTHFVGALGAGAKYNMGKHFGLRGQLKYSPTYLTTTDGGIWCDPFWGGCWTVGNSHYLHEFDMGGGITFRF